MRYLLMITVEPHPETHRVAALAHYAEALFQASLGVYAGGLQSGSAGWHFELGDGVCSMVCSHNGLSGDVDLRYTVIEAASHAAASAWALRKVGADSSVCVEVHALDDPAPAFRPTKMSNMIPNTTA
jgi:hypothetical protein